MLRVGVRTQIWAGAVISQLPKVLGAGCTGSLLPGLLPQKLQWACYLRPLCIFRCLPKLALSTIVRLLS